MDKKNKKKLKHNKKEKRERKSSSSDEEQWIEREMITSECVEMKSSNKVNRDEWMSLSSKLFTETKGKQEEAKVKESNQYDPCTSARELNPYWKQSSGNDGLPPSARFRKPANEEMFDFTCSRKASTSTQYGWRKKEDDDDDGGKVVKKEEEEIILSDKEMNEIASKIIKAEILGNNAKVKELKDKLEKARKQQRNLQEPVDAGTIGTTRKRRQKEKLFADDQYSLQQMFEKERRLNNKYCPYCIIQSESESFKQKNLMISSGGETVYLSLAQQPLTDFHCVLIPIRHVCCATQLDENEWSEMCDFRNALTNMFMAHNQDVIFYETVLNAHSSSAHMVLNCVPVSSREYGSLAPIYFKKAIDESETEWSLNKKLVSLKGKDVRKAIPKGLPYFFVSFGMTEGYAHVIENERNFSKYFAAEIIGGMLDLEPSKWRKPQQQQTNTTVLQFSNMWKKFDFNK